MDDLSRPLSIDLRLLSVLCSNSIKDQNIFQSKLPIYYQQHGRKIPKVGMKRQSKVHQFLSRKEG